MASIRDAKKYSARVNEHQISAKKLAKAAKLRAKAAKIREQVAKYDARIRQLQRKIADLERRANLLAGPPIK
jgi:chromosome segregation ATPase